MLIYVAAGTGSGKKKRRDDGQVSEDDLVSAAKVAKANAEAEAAKDSLINGKMTALVQVYLVARDS